MDPVEFIGIDPLFLTHAKLIIRDVLVLNKSENTPIDLYDYCGHRIKFVEICGIIVAVEFSSTSYRYTGVFLLDDGTGTIECVLWLNSMKLDNNRPFELGTTIRIMGKISTVRDEKQITVYDLYPTHDPHLEVTHFLQAIQLKKIYQQQVQMPHYLQTHGTDIIQQLNPSFVPLENTSLEDLVLQHLPLHAEFSLNSLRDHVELKKAAKQHLSHLKATELDHSILSAFQELVRKGAILAKSDGKGIYRRVNDEHLANTIIEIVDSMQHVSSHPHRSIRLDYIMTKVLETIDYSTLNKSRHKSNSLSYYAKSTDPADLSEFLSKLIPSATITATTTSTSTSISTPSSSVVFVTGSPTTTPSVLSTENNENSLDLGPIIGGCAGGFVLLIVLTITQRSFYLDKDDNIVPVTTIQPFQSTISKPPKVLDHAGQGHFDNTNIPYQINNNDATIKCYNLTTNIDTSQKKAPTRTPVTPGSFHTYTMSPTQYHTEPDHQTETTSITMQPTDERYQMYEPRSYTPDNLTDQSTVIHRQSPQPPSSYMPTNLNYLQSSNQSFLTEVSRYNTAIQPSDLSGINTHNKPYQYI
ncbi:CST complex subunit STN1 [Choanephora cucurbitarum]|uniref:CST complex subunit STN1 n=1 Tax=Choanephora cucurbitarum TaxID=101091 RepID=A0A1C7NK57_9FUNG|nr:CST complex subunit STN1 [Choanephora cucurbitarum]